MRILIISLLTISSLIAKAQNNVLYFENIPEGFAGARIPKQLLEKDMDFWQKTMEETHVNPYHAINREELLNLKKDILKLLPDSVTHFEASFAISELIGSLNEGHLGFASSRVSDSLYSYHCIRFPYLLYDIEDNSFIVQQDLSNIQKLAPFSRVIEVNGIAAKLLYEKYGKLYGGLEPWKRLMVKNNIRKLMYMDGFTSPFTIKAISGKDTLQFNVDGFTRQQADSINKALSASLPAFHPFSLRFLENNIAFIEFNTMNGMLRDSFSRFLRRSFEEIKLKKAAGVIIDLRKNGGGDSGLGDSLISYISNKPYRSSGGMKMRISEQSKAYNNLKNIEDPFSKWKNGSLYEYKGRNPTKPVDKKQRYDGKVCVLIGAGTFSSANMTTNAIKDYQLATLIGESTAEPGNDFGEIFSFMLPNTYIVAQTAIKMFTRANGDEKDFSGIKPDIEVRNSPEDVIQKKDRVIEKAVDWILNQ